VQALSEYESAQEEREFMRAVVAGLADIDAGRVVPLAEVKRRLGLD
jgi:predicted transcriptional regulator